MSDLGLSPPLKSTQGKQTWTQLFGCGLALGLTDYIQKSPQVAFVITPSNQLTYQLKSEIEFFLGRNTTEILIFPDWETLPYDQFSPHQDIISERLYTLSRLGQSNQAVVIAAIPTLMHRLCPKSYVNQYSLALKVNQLLNIEQFRHSLQEAGYFSVKQVMEHGEFALRGAIIDLFPMGSRVPFRIELFDEHIESLRSFDVETQCTIEKINQINILPAREFPIHEKSIAQFRRAFRERFTGNPSLSPVYETVSEGKFIGGLEYYMPLFFENTATIFDYLPKSTTLFFIEETDNVAEQFWRELSTRFEERNIDITRPLLPKEACFIPVNEFYTHAREYPQVKLKTIEGTIKSDYAFPMAKGPSLPIERKHHEPLKHLVNFLKTPGKRSLLVVESKGRREVILDMLKSSHLFPTLLDSFDDFLTGQNPISILTGPLLEGVELKNQNISIITEAQLFGETAVRSSQSFGKSTDPNLIIRDLVELRVGAPVVHIDFGVGRYQGLQYIENNGTLNEFLVLSYAGDDKIYVPVTSLNLIMRYTGSEPENAPLHRLGSSQWEKEKKKAQIQIHDVAIELLDTYAKREAKKGFKYTFDLLEYQRFASGFPFEETLDQQTAIEAIINDLTDPKPMDRLICGDVGFGKTEVAMRAAFIAVQNGKQVCVLVPTTLLASQHFTTFRDRFADFPIQIELLSRFRSAKESKSVLSLLEKGGVDIIIGTHKLFQKNIQFKNLGLLIIDEEHRFGVKQKEHIKALRTDIDILSMTATPIPRTLNMAMMGIRDISLITTPPAKRLAIKSFWQEKNPGLIREALLREILRGGQVFFLHNDIDSMHLLSEEIMTLVPEVKLKIAHGQMPERELERVMNDFYHQRFNVLLCTTIIETGIDIPTANTILINRADKFGLAQLHQLRGRVGRSHHQAYAYFLTPHRKLLTQDAIKRLDAIVSLDELGAGFTLATHDLEIRGAGELLGEEQSGNMNAIGFDLFMELLDQAVKALKSHKIPELDMPLHTGPEINLNISAIIPENYINDINTRLIFYKRIANAKEKQTLHNLQVEMIDRFGLLPQPLKHLLWITDLKLVAQKIGVVRIDVSNEQGKIEFSESPLVDPGALIKLIQIHAKRYQLEGSNRLKFQLSATNTEEKILEIKTLLINLSSHPL